MNVFLFDIDGTLLLTGGAGVVAVNRTFEHLYGLSPFCDVIHADGKTDPIILEELFRQGLKRKPTDAELVKVAEVYAQMMAEELIRASKFRLMPGVVEYLSVLSQMPNVALGLATGNLESTAWAKLKRGGLEHFFKFGGFASDSPIRRELTRRGLERARDHLGGRPMHQVYVVGDTIHDIDCGKFIGAKTIAVATGIASAEKLLEHQPDYFFPTLIEAQQALPQFALS